MRHSHDVKRHPTDVRRHSYDCESMRRYVDEESVNKLAISADLLAIEVPDTKHKEEGNLGAKTVKGKNNEEESKALKNDEE